MKFKKRAISLLLALLLIFNSSPIGHASRGDEISINGDVTDYVTDVVYGWTGGTYRFADGVLDGVDAGDDVYLVADATVEDLDGIPEADKEISVKFTNFQILGEHVQHYILPDLTGMEAEGTLKVLKKQLILRPAQTQAYYGQALPDNGSVSVSKDYEAQLVNTDEKVTVEGSFIFRLNDAVDVGTYKLARIDNIRLQGKDSKNYTAVIENEADLAFQIVPYETDAVADDGGAEGNHNGKTKAVLNAPEGFLISATGDLGREGWDSSIEIELEETETGTAVYYLRNNSQDPALRGAVCQKTYTYTAIPMPVVTGIELLPGSGNEMNGDVTKFHYERDAVYANGDVQVVVNVTGASFEQETEIFLSVNGEETASETTEVALKDGKYTYRAVFQLEATDNESIGYELSAYAKNSSGTGERYPAEDCKDHYLNYETPVTAPLYLDLKAPTVSLQSMETIYTQGIHVQIPQKIVAKFTVEDIHSGVAKVEYRWDDQNYQEYRGGKDPYQVTLSWRDAEGRLNGVHTLHIRVTDVMGNVYEASFDGTPVDYLPPVIDSILVEGVEDTQNGLLANKEVRIIVKAHDDASDVNSDVSGIQKVEVVGKKPREIGGFADYQAEAKWDDDAGGYVLVLQKGVLLKEIEIKVYDKKSHTPAALNQIPKTQAEPAEGEEPAEKTFYKSADLYIDGTAPSISFEAVTKLAIKYEEDGYWFGKEHKDKSITINVSDTGITAGLKHVRITNTTDSGKEYPDELYAFGIGSKDIVIPLEKFAEGTNTIVVTVEDYCGNTKTSDPLTFTKDTEDPEISNEDGIKLNAADQDTGNVKQLENEEWFVPEIVSDEKDGILSFRIGSTTGADKLSEIVVTINGGNAKTYLISDLKAKITHDDTGSYVYVSTKNIAPKAPNDEIPYNHYTIQAKLVDMGQNSVDVNKIIYVDKEDPQITKITVQKKDETLLSQIVRILSFGIFSNDKVVFRVYAEDGKGDIGLQNALMKYSDKEAEMKWDEDADCYWTEVGKNDLTKLGVNFSFVVHDKLGKADELHPIVQDAVNGEKGTESFFVMVESELPAMCVKLAPTDGIGEDGKTWYNGMSAAPNKTMDLRIQDVDSGLYSVVIDVNGEKEVLYQEKDHGTSGPDTGVFTESFDVYRNVKDQEIVLADGAYHIAVKVVDNAGNTETDEKVYYIDTVKPVINKISFSTATADDIQETESFVQEPKYSFFFNKNFDLYAHVSDKAPASEVYEVRYWIGSAEGEAKISKPEAGAAMIDVPDGHKGKVFYEVLDYAGNSSGILTTDSFVVDQTAPTIELTKNVSTDFRDNKNQPLYTTPNSITVTITDTVSGLQKISYAKSAERDPEELKGIEIKKTGRYTVGQQLDDGWKVVSMDGNLVTQVTKTFTFGEDDNNVQMTFSAVDQALNEKSEVQTEVFTIDQTAPVIQIDFDGENDSDHYYNHDRIARITVTERNFSAGRIKVVIENMFGDVPGYSFSSDPSDNTKHTATIVFDEGDYTRFDLSGTDLGNHAAEVIFVDGKQVPFYVDKTVPMIVENFWEFANDHENSFNTDKTAQIKIVEHNFDASLTNLKITRKAAGGEHSHNGMVDVTREILGGRTWTRNGDSYTIEFTFSEDAVYYVELAPSDLASNQGAKHNTVIFEIDKTAPVVSVKNGEAVGPEDTELLDIYPYDRREDPVPTVEFSDNNISHIEYMLIEYIPEYMGEGQVRVDRVEKEGTVQGNLFTLENFSEDGVYSLELIAVDVAGNRSEVDKNTYARMVNQDVLAFILDSNVKEKTGLYSLENAEGVPISKKPNDFQDLTILVMSPVDVPFEIVLRDTNGKETLVPTIPGPTQSVHGVIIHTLMVAADFFRDNFQVDNDIEMEMTVRNSEYRIDLARIHIDNIAPSFEFPEELHKWAWFRGTEKRTFVISGISEQLQVENCKVYDNGQKIDFDYSSEENTVSFTLDEGWHNVGVILCDAAGNENIYQEVNNIHIGNFWTIFYSSVGGMALVVAVYAVLRRRKHILQEMMEET